MRYRPRVRAFKRRLAAAAAVLLLHGHALCAEKALLLREREADREVTIREWTEDSPEGALLRSRSSTGDEETVWVDDSFAARRTWFVRPGARSDFQAVRQGNTIRIHGTVGGRRVERVQAIDGRPWLGLVELSLVDFVLSERTGSLSFWVIDSSTGNAHRLSVQKDGRESIVIAGTRVEAVRLRMTVPGLPALFWSAAWWFRASDGMFVKYEMARGMPGTPKTLLELIEEQ